MANPFKTGRSRTLIFSGQISGGAQVVTGMYFPGSNQVGAITRSDLVIQCLGIQFGCSAHLLLNPLAWSNGYTGPINGYEAFVALSVSRIGGANLFNNGTGAMSFAGPPAGTTMNGPWSIVCQVEEWCLVYEPPGFTTIDGTDFPNYGGPAEGDGLPIVGAQYYEAFIPGSTLDISIDVWPSGGVPYAPGGGTGPATYMASIAASGPVPGYNIFADSIASADGPISQSCSTTAILNTVSMTCPFSWTDGVGDSASASGGIFATCQGAGVQGGLPQYVYSTVECRASISPPIQYDISARLRSLNSPYPGTLTLDWLNTTNWVSGSPVNVITPITLNPNGSASVTQEAYQALAFHGGSQVAGISQLQQIPVSSWLTGLSGAGEDSRDWRCQFRGFPWDALTIKRNGNLTIDPCTATTHWTAGANTTLNTVGGHVNAVVSGGPGSVTLDTSTGIRVWEAFRYLSVTTGASTSGGSPPATIPITVGMAGETWTIDVPVGSPTVKTMDLCCSDSEATTKNQKSTRFKIKNPGGSPIATDPQDQYIFGWGVDWCDSVSFSNIPDTYTLQLDLVALTLSTATDKEQAFTVLEPFLNFVPGWTSGSDNTALQDFFYLQTDRRKTDVGVGLAHIVPTGAGSPSYRYFSIHEVITFMQYLPGITVTQLPDPTDTYHDSSLFCQMLAGSGATFNWGAGTWSDWVDRSLVSGIVTVQAQDLFDEVQVYPGAGQVFTQSGSYNVSTPLRVSKSLRAQGEGLVFKTDATPNPGQSVVAYLTSSPTTSGGTAITGNLGEYLTGTPYGNGNKDITTECRASSPYQDENSVWNNRYRPRCNYRQSRTGLAVLSGWDRPAQGWGYIASTDTGGVYINRYITTPDTVFTAEMFQADALCGNWASGAIDQQYMFYLEHGDTSIKYVSSYGKEDTWSMPTTITSGSDCASYYSREVNMTMVAIFTGTVGGSGDWQAWTSINNSSFINAGTIISGVMNTGGALVYEQGSVKQWRFAYTSGSSVITLVSQDGGQNWS